MNLTQKKLLVIRKINRWADSRKFSDIKVSPETKKRLSVLNKGLLQCMDTMEKAKHTINYLKLAQGRLDDVSKKMTNVASGKSAQLRGTELETALGWLEDAKKEGRLDLVQKSISQIKLALKGMTISK